MTKITIMLEPGQAAALHRLCDKISHSDAMAYLYPHIRPGVRTEQAGEMMGACSILQRALEHEGVSHWPWIETGRTR